MVAQLKEFQYIHPRCKDCNQILNADDSCPNCEDAIKQNEQDEIDKQFWKDYCDQNQVR